jgi:hypothetical protein
MFEFRLIVTGILLLLIVGGIYLIPSIIAFKSNHPNKGAIIALNILAGWTFIVWVVSLVWALSRHEETPREIYVVRESTSNQMVDRHEDHRYASAGPAPVNTPSRGYASKEDDIDIELF